MITLNTIFNKTEDDMIVLCVPRTRWRKVKPMQPMWLCLLWGRWFKETHLTVEKNYPHNEKLIGVCTPHQGPCGGLNRLPSHTKWSDDYHYYYAEIFFMAHNSQIALDHSQLSQPDKQRYFCEEKSIDLMRKLGGRWNPNLYKSDRTLQLSDLIH